MLTKVQKKRLAREARKLAMECVEGTAPKFGHPWPVCACGTAGVRAGVRWEALASAIFDARYGDAIQLVSDENTAHVWDGQTREAAIFPLLALADALEESSEQPPAGPSKDF